MELEKAMAALGVVDKAEFFAPDWTCRIGEMPAGPLPFLTPEYVAWACREDLQGAGIFPIPRIFTAMPKNQQALDTSELMAA